MRVHIMQILVNVLVCTLLNILVFACIYVDGIGYVMTSVIIMQGNKSVTMVEGLEVHNN